jgi:hypothetical protein
VSFDRRDIRRFMDVYTADNTYLGTVVAVRSGTVPTAADPAPRALQTSTVSGELLGPMPTQPLGNRAAALQTAATGYNVVEDADPLGEGSLVVGKWYGLLGRRTLPLDAVQTVSLERVVLRQRKAELDAAG